jgi:hypothetical protein
MIDKTKLELLSELFDRSESILIICEDSVSFDQLFAATALYGSLKSENKKNIKLLCSKKFSKEEKDISYVSEVQNEIGHENLCISLDYIEDSIDKVSYHVDEETKKFYLTVKPKKGELPLSDKNVEFSYTGADADMIILVGVNDLSSLGTLYIGYENLFNSAAMVSINSYETDFGNLKLDVSKLSSFSEFVSHLLIDLKIPIDSKSATSLLLGINAETNNLGSYSATADTFEVVSKLIRQGARRSFENSANEVRSDEEKGAGKDKVNHEVQKDVPRQVVKTEKKGDRNRSKKKKQNNWKRTKPVGGRKLS